jgi:hypothetical protein
MRHTLIVSVVTAIAMLTGFVAIDQLSAGRASSASDSAVSPAGGPGQVQGDTDCDTDVDAIDALSVLVDVAALEALAQQEPCTDVGDLIQFGGGLPGPPGPPGLSGYEIVEVEIVHQGNAVTVDTVDCPGNKVAVGGGLVIKGGVPAGSEVGLEIQDGPNEDGTGWIYQIRTTDSVSRTFAIRVICANVEE